MIKSFFILTLNFLICVSCICQDFQLEISGFSQKSNVAYIGVNNRIYLYFTNGEEYNDIMIATDNGLIENKNRSYIYRPDRLDNASIYVKSDNFGIDTAMSIQVKYLPFTFHLGSNHTLKENNFSITKEKFLRSGLSMQSTNTDLMARALILGFDLKVSNRDETILSKSYGKYTKEVALSFKNDLQIIKSGDIIQIQNLYYTYLDGVSILYKPIWMRIE